LLEACLTNEFQGREFIIQTPEGKQSMNPLDIFSKNSNFLYFKSFLEEFELGVSKCIGILICLFVGFGAMGLFFLKLLVKKMQ